MDDATAFLTGQPETQAGNRFNHTADNSGIRFPEVLSFT